MKLSSGGIVRTVVVSRERRFGGTWCFHPCGIMDAVGSSRGRQDISVGILIRLQAGLSTDRRSIPGRVRRILSPSLRLDRLLDDPSLLFDRCRVPFPVGKADEA